MKDLALRCKELGFGSRIVKSEIEVSVLEVQEMSGESLQEFHRLNHKEEMGIDKWLKLAKGREYDGDEVMLELLLEVYKKLERLEQKLCANDSVFLPMQGRVLTSYIGHEFLCFSEGLKEGGLFYARLDLPIFPQKLIPFYFKMLTSNIAQIIKMGSSHTKSYDAYVVECERMGIWESKQEERE